MKAEPDKAEGVEGGAGDLEVLDMGRSTSDQEGAGRVMVPGAEGGMSLGGAEGE